MKRRPESRRCLGDSPLFRVGTPVFVCGIIKTELDGLALAGLKLDAVEGFELMRGTVDFCVAVVDIDLNNFSARARTGVASP